MQPPSDNSVYVHLEVLNPDTNAAFKQLSSASWWLGCLATECGLRSKANKKVFRRTNGNTCKIGYEAAQAHGCVAAGLGALCIKTPKGLDEICTKAAARNFFTKQVNLLRQMLCVNLVAR